MQAKNENYPCASLVNMQDWRHATNKKYLNVLCDYWSKEFSWKKHEQFINSFKNDKTNVD